MVAPLPVREYASPDEMRQSYLAIHRAMLTPRHIAPKPPLFRDQIRHIPEPNRDVTVVAAAEARKRFLEESRVERLDRLKILQAARIVAAVSDVHLRDIMGDGRFGTHIRARWVAMYLARRTGRAESTVGYYLGGKDHTTVRNALQAIRPIAKHLHLDRCHDAVEIAQRLWEADWAVSDEAAR